MLQSATLSTTGPAIVNDSRSMTDGMRDALHLLWINLTPPTKTVKTFAIGRSLGGSSCSTPCGSADRRSSELDMGGDARRVLAPRLISKCSIGLKELGSLTCERFSKPQRAASVRASPAPTRSSHRSRSHKRNRLSLFLFPNLLIVNCKFHLNRSSNACFALGGPWGVPVSRSIVVRGSKSAHALRASFGETRAASVGLRAFKARAGVERHAIDAAVNVHAAAAAAGVEFDGDREPVAAARAAEHFVRRHEVRRLGSGGVLQRAPRSPRFGRLFLGPRLARLRLVLIAALTVFSVAHI